MTVRDIDIIRPMTGNRLAVLNLAQRKRFVGDPVVSNEADRAACLYGAAMMRKVGRLPSDMTAVDVLFQPPGTLVFISSDWRQIEVGRFVIPARVLSYDPRPIALPPAAE